MLFRSLLIPLSTLFISCFIIYLLLKFIETKFYLHKQYYNYCAKIEFSKPKKNFILLNTIFYNIMLQFYIVPLCNNIKQKAPKGAFAYKVEHCAQCDFTLEIIMALTRC